MPFLDHLEELRSRILRSLAAVILGSAVGLWAVQHFQLVTLLKRPIAPYLTDGKLVVLSPTEPVMIVFKLGFLVGLVLASPVILWQLWAFLAPALYAREKKALVPSLFVGLLLFLTGVALAYFFVVPQALRVLFSFQTEAIAPFITYDKYFSFVMQVTLALGISFELPLVIIILSWLGVVGPAELSRFRRFAVVLAFIAGAVLSPGADLLSMLMMTIPLLLLYEVGYAGSVFIGRRRPPRASAAGGTMGLLLLLGLFGTSAEAQERPRQRPPGTGLTTLRDSTRLGPDSLTAPRSGARHRHREPAGPSDRAVAQLRSARFGHDRAPGAARLSGHPVPGRLGDRLHGGSAGPAGGARRSPSAGARRWRRTRSPTAAPAASWMPPATPSCSTGDRCWSGQGIRYDTCIRRGVITDALTNFTEGSTVWFLRGNVSQDSSSNRIYAASSEITSCDLPVPHYHFSGRQVKVGLQERAGGPARGAVRAGCSHPLAAVHLSGHATGPALGDPDSAVRFQRPGSSGLAPTTARSATSATTGPPTTTWISPGGSTGIRTATSSTASVGSTTGSTGS